MAAALGALREQLETLTAEVQTREERDGTLATLVAGVADAARAAREDVERHMAARAAAESALATARERLAAAEAGRASQRARADAAEAGQRAELDALHADLDRTAAADT